MANFPPLIPSSRTFTPGDYPNSPFTALSGLESRVRHSNVMLGSRLTLGFRSISESDMLGILAHYQAQRGQYAPFDIPSSLLTGVSAANDYTLEGYQWRYVNPPSVTDIPCAGYDVSIELQSVGGVGAFVISTLQPTVQLQLEPGVAAAANGIAADIGFALDAGGAGGNGADLTVTATYDDNGATGEGFGDGINKSISILWTPSSSVALPEIGDPFEGGFFAGLISHTADGNPTHALIVAPRSTGASGGGYPQGSALRWRTTNVTMGNDGPRNTFDGALNTAQLIALGASLYPAANFCNNLTIGGFTDWYLPAWYELHIIYDNLKPNTTATSNSFGANPYSVPPRTTNRSGAGDPSQTDVAAFQTSGGEEFQPNAHWSSTMPIGSNNILTVNFSAGTDGLTAMTDTFQRTRAIRKIAL